MTTKERSDSYDLLRENNDKSTKELAQMIGVSTATVSKMRKRLGIEKYKCSDSRKRLMSCIDTAQSKKLYYFVTHNPYGNGIDSDVPCMVYQNNEHDITVVTGTDGVLCIHKRDFKQILDELQGIYEVYVR